MSAHTPGPLFVSDGAHADGAVDYAVYVESDGKRQIVAEFFGTAGHGTRFDSKSNARLYAAAPSLLDALHQVEAELQSLRTPSVADGIDYTLRTVRAAIAKARGE